MAPAPQKPAGGAGLPGSLAWLFARFNGRIGRQVYWLANVMYVALAGLVVRPVVDPETGAAMLPLDGPEVVLLFVLFVSNIAVAVKRLHDMGLNGFFAFLMFVPLLNIGFTVWIGFVPGQKGRNRYGERADVPPA